jgi:hypothetical protein
MATSRLTAKDRERFARARVAGEARRQDPSAVVEAAYDAAQEVIRVGFRSGGTMFIPARFVPELENQPTALLKQLDISPAGDAISWRALDVDVYVPGLVEHAFGTRLFAAANGRRGGQRRTKAKAAAARLNGAKGGRPRKRAPA